MVAHHTGSDRGTVARRAITVIPGRDARYPRQAAIVSVGPGASSPATVDDVHRATLAIPHVGVERGGSGNPVYQVGRRSFVYVRTPRPDAVDPDTGERYDDLIMICVASRALDRLD